jgi:glycosyltransferase involved in cell wall biosynthesis
VIITHVTNAVRNDGTGITNSVVDLAIAQAGGGEEVRIVCQRSDPDFVSFLRAYGVGVLSADEATHPEVQQAIRDSDVIHVHTAKAVLLALRLAPVTYWRASVSTFHNPHQRSTLLLLAARRHVALNARDARLLSRLNPLARPVAIGNGTVGSKRLSPADEVEAEPLPQLSIVYVGALHRRKGLDVLLGAVARVRLQVPDVQLFVVGNRDDESFEKLAVELGVADCTTFAGFRPDPRGFMRGAGVFVLPSRDEGFGNVLIEARSVGAPIVASRVGGIPDALAGGRAGRLVTPGDVEELAAALVEVLTDDQLRAELSRRAGDQLDDLRIEHFRDQYRVVYESLATGPTARESGQPHTRNGRKS